MLGLKRSGSVVDTTRMPPLEMGRRASSIAVVGFVLVSLGIGAFAGLFNLFSVDAVAASRIAASGPESWIGRPGAWQWDAIMALGIAGALMSGYTAAVLRRCGHPRQLYAAAGWALVEFGLLGLVWHASTNTGGGLLLWQLVGVALLLTAATSTPAEI